MQLCVPKSLKKQICRCVFTTVNLSNEYEEIPVKTRHTLESSLWRTHLHLLLVFGWFHDDADKELMPIHTNGVPLLVSSSREANMFVRSFVRWWLLSSYARKLNVDWGPLYMAVAGETCKFPEKFPCAAPNVLVLGWLGDAPLRKHIVSLLICARVSHNLYHRLIVPTIERMQYMKTNKQASAPAWALV